MVPTRDYWLERMAQTHADALNAPSARHREVYLRLIETYASLAGTGDRHANDNRWTPSVVEQGAQELRKGFAS